MKIADYKIIEQYFKENLEKEVNEAIADGWQPYGNLIACLIQSNNCMIYVQAMIKH
jgi:hypothetical protein